MEQTLNWLPLAQVESTHADSRDRANAIENPAVWILDNSEFVNWIDVRASSALWLHGRMDTGKMVLTSTVLEQMKSLYGTTASGAFTFYYCSTSITDANITRSILGSILRQLVQTGRGVEKFTNWRRIHSQSDWTCNCLRDMIQKLIEMNDKTQTTIIIDGLDELDAETLHILLKILLHLL